MTTAAIPIPIPPETPHLPPPPPTSAAAPTSALPSHRHRRRSQPATSGWPPPPPLHPPPTSLSPSATGTGTATGTANRAHLASHRRFSAGSVTNQQRVPSNPQYEHERADVARFHRRTSSSRDGDRDPSASGTSSSSRPQRRHSHRSALPQRPAVAADMASTVAHNAGPAPVQPAAAAADPRASASATKARSRTTIPTQSGKWILGKTIGAGSMGKVKLAKKEDSSEQASARTTTFFAPHPPSPPPPPPSDPRPVLRYANVALLRQ